jgi:hypothetical protein
MFIIIVISVISLFYILSGPDERMDSYKQHCVEQKGHIYMPADIAFCLSEDGRMIEVYP